MCFFCPWDTNKTTIVGGSVWTLKWVFAWQEPGVLPGAPKKAREARRGAQWAVRAIKLMSPMRVELGLPCHAPLHQVGPLLALRTLCARIDPMVFLWVFSPKGERPRGSCMPCQELLAEATPGAQSSPSEGHFDSVAAAADLLTFWSSAKVPNM